MPDDIRAKITEALREHFKLHRAGRPEEWVCGGCHADFHNFRCHEDHVAEVLLSLEGVAIVALPALMVDRSNVAESIKDRPMWEVGGAWTSLTDNAGEIEFEADNQNACGCLNSPAEARALAAVLLAAAEAVTDA